MPTPSPQDGRPEPVATGDRRDEMRYEDDRAQLAKVRHTFNPGAAPPEEHSAGAEATHRVEVEDIAVVKPSPSVWDARPPPD